MINVHVTYECGTKEKRDLLLESLKPLGKIVECEPGNRGYHYYYDTEDDSVLFLWEQWENQESLDLHFGTENMKKIGEAKERVGAVTHLSRTVDAEVIEL